MTKHINLFIIFTLTFAFVFTFANGASLKKRAASQYAQNWTTTFKKNADCSIEGYITFSLCDDPSELEVSGAFTKGFDGKPQSYTFEIYDTKGKLINTFKPKFECFPG
ncbi:243_t:CDS:2, partial [Ambispora gerdemannii]